MLCSLHVYGWLGEACTRGSSTTFFGNISKDEWRGNLYSTTMPVYNSQISEKYSILTVPLKEIHFTSPSTKRQRIDISNPTGNTLSSTLSVPSLNAKPPDEHELEALFTNLHSCDGKPALLSFYSDIQADVFRRQSSATFPCLCNCCSKPSIWT